MRTMLAAVAALFAVGCAQVPVTQRLHTVSRATYDTSEKRAAWGRALESFQEHNVIVTLVDYEAGILASGSQPEVVPCAGAGGKCESSTGWQFTMSDDGTALFSVRRGVTGMLDAYSSTKLLPPESEARLCKDADETLAFIIGPKGVVKPQPPKPAEARRLSRGDWCSNDGECETGLSCLMRRCAR
jgi:hypothetical protein